MKTLLSEIQSPVDLKKLSPAELAKLAGEIREEIIRTVATNGGHLASNLGVVELTIALHKVFDTPRDKFVWDVGHQCYPHKLLTGRRKNFSSLRSRNGVSGFPRTTESLHDSFIAGHGSTSVSAALGMATARDLLGEKYHVVGVCGDGAMSGGMVFEALNHAGESGKNLILILNDNSYSIAPVTGALSRYLSKIRSSASYIRMHDTLHGLKKRSSAGAAMSFLSSPLRRLGKYLVFKKGIIFEELGFKYIGPIDGHNIGELVNELEKARMYQGPTLLHVITQKGRGYEPAENDPSKYHGVSKLDSGPKTAPAPSLSFTNVFCDSMERLCENDDRIVGITAAMSTGTGLKKLMDKYPRRFFDVGMAEPHAVTFAAGLASQGLRPVAAIYSTFLQRAYDQIFHDVCLQNLPVIFAIDRAGLVSKYGQTHQGVLDIAYLRHLPNMVILAPRDAIELSDMLEFALTLNRPVAIRYPDESAATSVRTAAPLEFGKAEILCEGNDVAVWAVGVMADRALKAAAILRGQGIEATVYNVRFVHPMDEATLIDAALNRNIANHVTVEDHLLDCGFGSLFLETVNRLDLRDLRIERIGVESCLVPDDSRDNLMKDFDLDAEKIADRIARKIAPRPHRQVPAEG